VLDLRTSFGVDFFLDLAASLPFGLVRVEARPASFSVESRAAEKRAATGVVLRELGFSPPVPVASSPEASFPCGAAVRSPFARFPCRRYSGFRSYGSPEARRRVLLVLLVLFPAAVLEFQASPPPPGFGLTAVGLSGLAKRAALRCHRVRFFFEARRRSCSSSIFIQPRRAVSLPRALSFSFGRQELPSPFARKSARFALQYSMLGSDFQRRPHDRDIV
jgi:hypothetical protein